MKPKFITPFLLWPLFSLWFNFLFFSCSLAHLTFVQIKLVLIPEPVHLLGILLTLVVSWLDLYLNSCIPSFFPGYCSLIPWPPWHFGTNAISLLDSWFQSNSINQCVFCFDQISMPGRSCSFFRNILRPILIMSAGINSQHAFCLHVYLSFSSSRM